MTTLNELLEQQKQLQEEIERLRNEERGSAIQQALALIKAYDLRPTDLFTELPKRGKGADKPASKLPPKYRDPITGATWAGKGRMPGWLTDKNDEKFKISE